MIEEAYVSFETSKLLKENGFKESTQLVWYEHLPSTVAFYSSDIGKTKRDLFYWDEESERNSPWANDSPVPSYISGEVYSCPTHQMTIEWISQTYLVEIIVTCGITPIDGVDQLVYYWDIVKVCGNHLEYPALDKSKPYLKRKDAVEAGMLYYLKNIEYINNY